jgi:UDP-glucose 4-epimerase
VRVFITGGAGFIGSHLCDALVARGDEVSILDNLSTGSRVNIAHLEGKIKVSQGDIRDKDLVEALVAEQIEMTIFFERGPQKDESKRF